jgi:tryptophan halogenase
MNAPAIEKVIIVGGGISGWTAAVAIGQAFAEQKLQLTLLDTGAAETEALATHPQSLAFLSNLGLNEIELVKKARASFRLGTLFDAWNHPRHQYLQPFGSHGGPLGQVSFQHFAIKRRLLGDSGAFEDYSLGAVAARAGKFRHPESNPQSIFSTLAYAHHIGRQDLEQLLAERAQQLGVKVVRGAVEDVALDADSGFIASVLLDSGERLAGELFIDCSGPQATLIGQALGQGLDDWSKWFATDRVIRCSAPQAVPREPYTRVTGHERGWLRQVPLQNEVQAEFHFSSQDLNEDQASEALAKALQDQAPGAFETSDVIHGLRDQPWFKNCVAFGEAAGRVEPLDVSNLALVFNAVQRFLGLFPDRSCSPLLARRFNRLTRWEFENLRDLSLLRFQAVARDDAALWSQWRNQPLPDSLRRKMSLFQSNGQIAYREQEVFFEPYQAAAFIGLEKWPDSYDPFLDAFDFEELTQRFDGMKRMIQETAAQMPSHHALFG